MTETADEFWRFSLAVYAGPGVAACCLDLQDRFGRDVVLALYCGWLGISGRGALGQDDLAGAEAAVMPWRRSVIEPVRALRRALKGVEDADEFYAGIKKIELRAEHRAHERLAALAPATDSGSSPENRLRAARANLALYLGGSALGAAEALLAAFAEFAH